jgi:hypothetical protein
MHVIIIIHKTFSVKVGLNIKLTQLSSNLLLTLFMIPKVFQILYSTYHKLNGGLFFVIFLLTQVFNLLSCVYIKKIIIFKLHFRKTIFFVYLTMPTPYVGN